MAKSSEKTAKATAAKPKAKAVAATKPPRQPGVERRKNHPMRAQHGYFHLLLTHAVEHLGSPGDLVKVRPGYARNYLVPLGLATYATPHNLQVVEKHRQRLKAIEEARRADLLNLAGQIAQESISIEANANDEGHLYGSVNADMIAEKLRQKNFPIEAENVRIEGPLKETGLYTIRIHLAQEVETDVKLWVVPTHTEEPAA